MKETRAVFLHTSAANARGRHPEQDLVSYKFVWLGRGALLGVAVGGAPEDCEGRHGWRMKNAIMIPRLSYYVGMFVSIFVCGLPVSSIRCRREDGVVKMASSIGNKAIWFGQVSHVRGRTARSL